mgnify:FL=1
MDVIENNRKVTHGCIIATLKLYLPDGKEAKASPSIVESNTHGMWGVVMATGTQTLRLLPDEYAKWDGSEVPHENDTKFHSS